MRKFLKIISGFFDFSLSLDDEARRAKLLKLLLGALAVIDSFGFVILFSIDLLTPASNLGSPRYMFYLSIILFFAIIILLFLNRFWRGFFARTLFVGVLLLFGLFDIPAQVAGGRALLYFTLPIIAASIFLRPWASFVLAAITSGIIAFYARFMLPVLVPIPYAEMVGLFLVALILWVTTLSLERYIQQLRETNQVLKESEERYRSLVDISPELVVLSDAQGTIQVVNRAGLHLFGYESPSEVIGKKNWDFMIPEEQQRAATGLASVVNRGSILGSEYQVLKKDGSVIWLEFSASVLRDASGKPSAILSVGRDITLRKKMELALLVSRDELEQKVVDKTLELSLASQRLDELVVRSPAVIYSASLAEQPVLTFVSENVIHLLGYGTSQFLDEGSLWPRLIHEEDVAQVRIDVAFLKTDGKMSREYRFLHKDGTYRWIRDEVKLAYGLGEKPLELVGYWVDITEQKQTEQSYQILVETSLQGLIVLQRERVVLANQAYANIIGISLEEIYGFSAGKIFETIHPDDRHRVRQWFEARLAGEQAPVGYEARIVHSNGQVRWLEVSPALIDYHGERAVQVTLMDITERKNAENSLVSANNQLERRVAERTAELVASGEQLRNLTRRVVSTQENERRRIARELHDESGQALIGMIFSLDEILSEIPDSLLHVRNKISKTIGIADGLTQNIRNIAHGLRPSILDVAGINLSLSGFCREFSEQTHFPVKYSGVELSGVSDDVSITLYRFVQEALTNVIKHAHATEAHIVLRKNRGAIHLSVQDNGGGFDIANTRKDIGLLGMQERLGLLNGKLELRSQPGKGTLLKAIIPLLDEVIN